MDSLMAQGMFSDEYRFWFSNGSHRATKIIIEIWVCDFGLEHQDGRGRRSTYKNEYLKSHIESNKTQTVCEETKLNQNLRFNIKDYTTLRKDRPGKFGGGLAVLIKTLEIKFKEIAYNQSKPRESTTEAQAIEIYLTDETISIINVYHHDNTSINTCLLETLSEASSDIAIILGDFNAERPTWGSPVQDNKDNGNEFVSGEFEQFTKMNGIRNTKTSPYNPITNGLAERYVREYKNLLRKNNGKDDLETNLQRFLFAHRAFPQTVIKEFPCGTANEEKFKIKILEFNTKMGNPREVFHGAVRRQEQFTTGCEVYFRNYATGPKR
ncbi:K02A2.6-like [Cordylochernes scorpioides]|uniref:K02A2.6-like n=1 Tax=Cordylochernes scorpioides TaxID=51811 RepID=A0ABY6KS70_9ARAC|nr:K02A2.6-like [Cordylochernes scorpioides]